MLEPLEIPEILAQMVILGIITLMEMAFIMLTVDTLRETAKVDAITANMGYST